MSAKFLTAVDFFHNQLFYPHEPSKSGVLYNILLIIIMFVYSTTILVLKLLDQNHVESAMVKIIDKILLMSGIFIVLFVWLIYVLQKKTIVTILNRLYDVNYSLKKCRKYTLESDSFVYITGFCNFALCFSIAILEIIVDSKYTAIMWAIPFIVGTSVFAQYTIFLSIIVQFFKSINKTILKIGNLSSKNEIKVSFVTKILYEDSLIKDIYNINFDFINLCEISNQIADFYAIPILVLTIYFVPTTTYNLYFMILSFIVSDDKSTIALYFDCGILIFCIFLSYAALTTNVTRITREVRTTMHCIYLLSNQCTLNPKAKEVLADFSYSLIHRRLEFTTYGVMNLNGFLLQNIFGTIISYLIILLQFPHQQ